MFALLPTKHRKNVYVYFRGKSGEKSGGDEDIKVSSKWNDPNISKNMESVIAENSRILSMSKQQQVDVTNLRNALELNRQKLKTLEDYRKNNETLNKNPIPSTKVDLIDKDLVKVRAELSAAKTELNSSIEQYNLCTKTLEKLTNEMNSLNSSYNTLNSDNNALKSNYNTLNSSYNTLNSDNNALKSSYNTLNEIDLQKDMELKVIGDQLKVSIDERSAILKQRETLSVQVDSLRNDLAILQKERDQTVLAEKERGTELQKELTAAREELDMLQKKYAKELQDLQAMYETERIGRASSLSTIEDLKKEISQAKDRLKLCDETCKQQLINLSKEAHDRAVNLEKESKILEDKLKDSEKDAKITAIVEQKSRKEIELLCEQNKIDIREMMKYISRQVQIYELSLGTISGNATWDTFVKNNKALYESGRVIISKMPMNDEDLMARRDCEILYELHLQTVEHFNRMKALDSTLVNLHEDAAGGVRVYVRMRPLGFGNGKDGRSIVKKQGKSVLYSGNLCSNPQPVKTYGRFFGVIPETFQNADLYTGCSGTVVDPKTYAIMSHTVKNEQGQYCCLTNDASGMCRVINQLKDGYHVILFGYGHSGSGKTLTLFGDSEKNEPGMSQLAVANAGAKTVYLKELFELTYDKIDFRSKNFNSGRAIDLFHRGNKSGRVLKTLPDTMIHNETLEFDRLINANMPDIVQKQKDMEKQQKVHMSQQRANPFKTVPITAKELFQLRHALDVHRTGKGRIKPTPNNPQSSRSHLFMTLEFVYESGAKGYLTIVDMGGRESSMDILNMYLEKPTNESWQMSSLLMNDPKLIPKYITPHNFTVKDMSLSHFFDQKRYVQDVNYKNEIDVYVGSLNKISHDTQKVINVLKESIYINETLNQLTIFFKQRQDSTRVHNVKEIKYPLDDKKNVYDPSHFMMYPNASEKIGMYRILTQLATIHGQSKFVMICNIRQDTKPSNFCMSTREALDFAHNMRST